jgi:ribosome recycling factor
MIKSVLQKAEADMKKALEVMTRDFGTIRTGRASLSLLEGITVEYYGNPTPLNQVASLSVPEPRTITIQPWDLKVMPHIEKAIIKSDLGITPNNDGKVLRLNIPPLTQERRKELVKIIKKMAEEGRVAIRNVRRDANEQLKKLEKDKKITEDELHKSIDKVQEITDNLIKQAEEVLAKKEKEIMEF